MIYDVDYFIKKFEAIPENKWITCRLYDNCGRHCAEGWALEFGGQECKNHLQGHFNKIGIRWASEVNNEPFDRYQQETPKQRVLAALYDIQKLEAPKEEPKKKIEYTVREVEIERDIREDFHQKVLAGETLS